MSSEPTRALECVVCGDLEPVRRKGGLGWLDMTVARAFAGKPLTSGFYCSENCALVAFEKAIKEARKGLHE